MLSRLVLALTIGVEHAGFSLGFLVIMLSRRLQRVLYIDKRHARHYIPCVFGFEGCLRVLRSDPLKKYRQHNQTAGYSKHVFMITF